MRLHSLQGLRAVCITLVVLSHLSGTQNFPRVHLLEIYGNLGVRIFLVDSGYLITAQLIRQYEKTGTISLSTFYARRAFRIFPAAYVFMAVAIVTHWTALSAGNIATALAYCVNYYPQGGHHVLGHLWSLGVEERYYLLWPLTLLLFFRRRLWIVVAVIAAGPPLRILFYLLWGRAGLNHPFPVFMDALGTGAAMAIVEAMRLPFFARLERAFASRWCMAVPILTALLPSLQLWNTRIYQVLGLSALHVGIALSIKHVLARRYSLLNVWPTMWLGAISYSLYLWQQIFLDRASRAWWMAFPQNLLFGVLLATVSYWFVEKPFLRVRERWTKKRSLHLVGAFAPRQSAEPVISSCRPAV